MERLRDDEQWSSGRRAAHVQLPTVEPEELRRWIRSIDRLAVATRSQFRALKLLLEVSQEPLRVIDTAGGGVAQHRVLVPESIETILALDASYHARKLVQLDDTLKDAEKVLPIFKQLPKRLAALKRWDNVEFYHLLAAGGRRTIVDHFANRDPSKHWYAKEIATFLKEHAGDAPVLIYHYVARPGQVDVQKELQRDLERHEVNLAEKVEVNGESVAKYRWARWGSHDATNEHRDCQTVVMVGVLQRDRLELTAAALGQLRDSSADISNELVSKLVQSEAGHLVIQGAARAQCRQVAGDHALPTKVFLIHRAKAIRKYANRVMPGARWYDVKKPARGVRRAALTRLAAEAIASVIHRLPEDRISTKALKKRDSQVVRLNPSTYSDALGMALEGLGGAWVREGRSVVRVGSEEISRS